MRSRIPSRCSGRIRRSGSEVAASASLSVIAQHADVWNAPGGEPDEVARLAGILDAHCADVGRDPAEIRRSVQIRYAGDDDALLRAAEAFVQRNIRDLI